MQQPGYNVPHTQVRGEPMQSPEDVAAMLRLKACVLVHNVHRRRVSEAPLLIYRVELDVPVLRLPCPVCGTTRAAACAVSASYCRSVRRPDSSSTEQQAPPPWPTGLPSAA